MAKRRPSPAGHLPLDYYANIPLAERRVLQLLHGKVGQVIPRVEAIGPRTFGFQVEEGHITGVGLHAKNLDQLPECIGALQNLQTLNVSGNILWKVPLSLTLSTNLSEIDLRNNRLWFIPQSIRDLPNLERLELAGNPVAVSRQRTTPTPAPGEEEKQGVTAEVPPTPEAYYRTYFGFDPVADRHPMPGGYYYEAEFPLENDPPLHQLGVTIAARVNVYKDEFAGDGRGGEGEEDEFAGDGREGEGEEERGVQNRIVFRREGRVAEVTCVHTAVGSLSAEDVERWTEEETPEEGILEWARSTENHPVNLPPAEHFASLKSYVQGIAEIGLGTMMTASYQSDTVNPQTLPFGFNSMMHQQVAQCLAQLAPSAMTAMLRDLMLVLAESVPAEWFLSRLDFFAGTYSRQAIEEAIFGDRDTFQAIDERVHDQGLRIRAARSPQATAPVLEYLATLNDPEVRRALRNFIHTNHRALPGPI